MLTFIYFVIVLGITITIHEFGHFITAKKNGVYCYEFSIGMGPQIFKWHRKNDETEYSIRLFPIGGFVQMAGEEIDDDTDVPKDKKLVSKSTSQQLVIVLAGIFNNFVLAIVLLFIVGLVGGSPTNTAKVGMIDPKSPAYVSGLQTDDIIINYNDKEIKTYDDLSLYLVVNEGKTADFVVNRNTKELNITVKPEKVTTDGKETYKYGFKIAQDKNQGVINALKFSFTKTFSLIKQMLLIVWFLITGKISLDSLSGPVGIYSIVGTAAESGFLNIVYLTAYLSINVGIINLLPVPAFDGCRALFLVIGKIKGSRINPKIENTINAVGLVLLMVLMVYITYNDILNLIK